MNDDMTTIQLKKSLVRELNKIKKYERQTYNDIISDLVSFAKSERMKGEYEEFIARVQQRRMRELWDTEKEEVWVNV